MAEVEESRQTVSLMPEYLVVCCWRSIKEVSLLLGELSQRVPITQPGAVSQQQVRHLEQNLSPSPHCPPPPHPPPHPTPPHPHFFFFSFFLLFLHLFVLYWDGCFGIFSFSFSSLGLSSLRKVSKKLNILNAALCGVTAVFV